MPRYLRIPLILVPLAGARAGAIDFTPARRTLEEAIAERAFPGCAVAVGRHDEVLWKEGVGRLDYADGPRVSTRTLYDLASLTKVVGTTTVAAVLLARGSLSLDAKVSRYIPEFSGGGRETVTIEHLLTHSAGLPAWTPLFESRKGYPDVIAGVIGATLETKPGSQERYSDLGFMLLGEVIERVGGAPLPALERALVFDRLGLGDTIRNPPREELERIAPTEVRPQAPGDSPRATRGIVHDENALAGGGVTGHAGLFSTADDLALFAQEMLKAWRGESALIPGPLARKLLSRRELVPGSSRALGWDTPSGESSAGTLFGPRSFGHTGFTGTSLWMDPDRDLFVLLLSNRVHPERDNSKIGAVRRKLADRVVLCVEGRLQRL